MQVIIIIIIVHFGVNNKYNNANFGYNPGGNNRIFIG
jgi:hypothetical protein